VSLGGCFFRPFRLATVAAPRRALRLAKEVRVMRNGVKLAKFALAAAVLVSIVALLFVRSSGQTQRVARIDGHPNFSGVWQALNEANWDLEAHNARAGFVTQQGIHPVAEVPGAPALVLGAAGSVPGSIGVVEGGTIPYQPWALAQKKDNQQHWLDRDPEVKCFLTGTPRSMYLPHPFQIFQSSKNVEIQFSYSSSGRTIHLEKVEPLPDDSYHGFSLGRWEGDTLVVESTGFNGKTWFDRAGNFASEQMKVTERFTPAGSLDDMFALRYEATIEDPKVFTRPWKISMPLYRRIEPNAQLMEFRCTEFVEELAFGHLRKEQLVKRYEGETLNIDITRKVPTDPAVLYQRDYVMPDRSATSTQ
jgi:hypothetical protein